MTFRVLVDIPSDGLGDEPDAVQDARWPSLAPLSAVVEDRAQLHADGALPPAPADYERMATTLADLQFVAFDCLMLRHLMRSV